MRVLAAVMLMFLLVAGCTGAHGVGPHALATSNTDTRSQVIPTVSVDKERPLGTLDGTVVGDDELPVAYAHAKVLELNAAAVADAKGYFTFGKINVGNFFMSVTADGYEPKQVGVEVVEGKETSITVKLKEIPVPVPRAEVFQPRGYVNCRVVVFTPLGATNGNSKGTCSTDPTGSDNGTRTGDVGSEPGLAAVLAEAHWSASSSTSRVLSLSAGGSIAASNPLAQANAWKVTGASPIAIPINHDMLANWTKADSSHTDYTHQNGKIGWSLEVGPSVTGQAVDVGVGMFQPVDLALTLFYVKAPADLNSARVYH